MSTTPQDNSFTGCPARKGGGLPLRRYALIQFEPTCPISLSKEIMKIKDLTGRKAKCIV